MSSRGRAARRQRLRQQKTAAETVAGDRTGETVAEYKRVVFGRPGGPEVLQVRQEDLPEPGLVVVGFASLKALLTRRPPGTKGEWSPLPAAPGPSRVAGR